MKQSITQILTETLDPSPRSKFVKESFSIQTQSAKFQNSPANSLGSGKESPLIYHSPQINNKQKLSKFLNDANYSPALKNRMIVQNSTTSSVRQGSNSISFIKQFENFKDNFSTVELEKKAFTPRQNGYMNSVISHTAQNNQIQLEGNTHIKKYSIQGNFGQLNNQKNHQIIQNTSDNFLSKKNKKEEQITLPQIQPQSSIKQVKKQLINQEEKASFFNQINRYARKSLCAQPTQNIDSMKKTETVPDSPVVAFVNNTIELHQPSDNFSLNQGGSCQNFKRSDSISLKKSPQIKSIGRLSIFHENLPDNTKELNLQVKLDSETKLTLQSPQKILSLSSVITNSHSQFPQIQSQTRSSLNEEHSQSTFSFIQQKQLETPKNISSLKSPTQKTPSKNSPFKKNLIFFAEPIPEDPTPAATLREINDHQNNQQSLQNQKKDSIKSLTSSSFSSDDDEDDVEEEKQTETPQIPQASIIQRPQKKYLIRKMSDCVEQNQFFSPQIKPNTLRRRGTTQFVGGQALQPLGRNSIMIRPLNTDKESIFSNTKSNTQFNETCFEDRPALMREFYYLLNDMKQYVIEQIQKNSSLMQDICAFYMIQDIQDFSFHFGQFLEFLAEQYSLKENSFPYKFPKNIFSKINTFMHDFISKNSSNKEQLSKLLDEQLAKSMQVVTPSTQLEALGGYFKIKDMSEQITNLLYTSGLVDHVIIVSKEVTSKKIEEFLLAVLNNDTCKVKSMIDEFKKHSGTGFLCTEFFMLKQVIFKFFDQNKYYSDDVRYSFFELIEGLRFQIITEQGFSQYFLDSKQEALLKELQLIWRQDPILNKLKEISKNSSNQFIQVVYDFTFSQKNCHQLRQSFQDCFISANFDILIVKSLHQMIKVATKRQNLTQQNVQLNLNYLFKKLQWFISNENNNYVNLIGDHQVFSQLMSSQFFHQKTSKEFNTATQTKESLTNFNEIEKSNKSPSISKLNSNNQQSKNRKSINLPQQNQKSSFDISCFTQFISLFFNYSTTYHYSDLGSLFRIEKCSPDIYKFWATLFGDCLIQDLKISESSANELKKFVLDLFEFERINQLQQQE